MPEYMTSYPMTSLTLDAIACKEEDAVVVEYILKGKYKYFCHGNFHDDFNILDICDFHNSLCQLRSDLEYLP